ncbi:DNA-methyltransferase [Tellurirhabdus bombi]|uniref:DNA-methyltransferase n=1 Tax=Tellurirhabdus bombi TaxID=2907205 RepID=UPI001F2C68B5|nr:site-specific DNA-methyltransferase [Tellurirhabdus bombi]
MLELNKIHNMDCLAGLRLLPDNSVDCCVTSPPYYALRDYGHADQIGLEDTPEAFIQKLVDVFREVLRVLKPEGTCWINIGDSYWGGKGKSGQSYSPDYQNERYSKGRSYNGSHHQIAGKGITRPTDRKHPDYKPKDLIGVPWMLAFALRADGWYLRQDIIWSKPNPMPESVVDRCTKSHEYIFLLTKSASYYYDIEAVKEPIAAASVARLNQDLEQQKGSDRVPGKTNGTMKAVIGKSGNKARKSGSERGCPEGSGSNVCGSVPWEGSQRNKRSVWTVATRPFSEAHFATFPPDLIVPCIKAGCPKGGLVLDPFMGAGTVAMVSQKLGRKYIGFELNPEYVAIAERRVNTEVGPLTALFQ